MTLHRSHTFLAALLVSPLLVVACSSSDTNGDSGEGGRLESSEGGTSGSGAGAAGAQGGTRAAGGTSIGFPSGGGAGGSTSHAGAAGHSGNGSAGQTAGAGGGGAGKSGGTGGGGAGPGPGPGPGPIGAGGNPGTGGTPGTGGDNGVGGDPGTGGTQANGGETGAGGDPGSGGDTGSGGSVVGGGKLLVGYYQSWSDSWKATGAETVLAHLPSYVNVVNLSFMEPNASYTKGSMSLGGTGFGVPYDGPTLKDAVAALHANHPGTKVVMSVGGATFPSWSSFAPQAVADFVEDFGLDGVDLDYEPSSPACTASGGTVSCPSDAEFVSVVKAMRAVMPRPKLLSIAAWSVGAYGEGDWADAQPASAYMGLVLAVLKDPDSSAALDLLNVMSYDASPAYDPKIALAAYSHYFKGPIAMGIEVPPEAWGGHVETVSEIDSLADEVNAKGGAGLMLWSLQKQGPAQDFASEMCTKLGLSDCSSPLF